jgi:hypothetical protein
MTFSVTNGYVEFIASPSIDSDIAAPWIGWLAARSCDITIQVLLAYVDHYLAIDDDLIAIRTKDVTRLYHHLTIALPPLAPNTADNTPTVKQTVVTPQLFQKIGLVLCKVRCGDQLALEETSAFQAIIVAKCACLSICRYHWTTSDLT